MLAITRRYYDPYGAPRGTPVTWADNRGYLGQPADPATGLTYDGARAYDPVADRFISPDPLLKPADPRDLNPYAYAEDNPVTGSDPTGLMPCDTEGCCGSYQYLGTLPGNTGTATGGTCPDYLSGCPGFTGGGAGPGGETLHGPGYSPGPAPVIRTVKQPAASSSGAPTAPTSAAGSDSAAPTSTRRKQRPSPAASTPSTGSLTQLYRGSCGTG